MRTYELFFNHGNLDTGMSTRRVILQLVDNNKTPEEFDVDQTLKLVEECSKVAQDWSCRRFLRFEDDEFLKFLDGYVFQHDAELKTFLQMTLPNISRALVLFRDMEIVYTEKLAIGVDASRTVAENRKRAAFNHKRNAKRRVIFLEGAVSCGKSTYLKHIQETQDIAILGEHSKTELWFDVLLKIEDIVIREAIMLLYNDAMLMFTTTKDLLMDRSLCDWATFTSFLPLAEQNLGEPYPPELRTRVEDLMNKINALQLKLFERLRALEPEMKILVALIKFRNAKDGVANVIKRANNDPQRLFELKIYTEENYELLQRITHINIRHTSVLPYVSFQDHILEDNSVASFQKLEKALDDQFMFTAPITVPGSYMDKA